MSSDLVTLADYEGVNTFGISSMRELADLSKALEAGYQYPPTDGGSALRVESLESSLKVLTHQAKHCAFWQKVAKIPAYSTVEEYNQLVAVGGETGAFVPEGVLPEAEDSTYARAHQLVKFLGTTRSLSHVMTLVRTMVGDVVAQENSNGILWMLKNAEWGLFNGDADMCYLGAATDATHREWYEFNGVEKQIDSSSVIDMQGGALLESTFDDAAQMIAGNYGVPTDCFLSFSAHKDLSKVLAPMQRIGVPVSGDGGISLGAYVNDVKTPFGAVNLNPDVFLNTGKVAPTSVATNLSGKVPTAPATVAIQGSLAGTDGVWTTHGGAGVYSYSVSAANRYGESVATAISADITITSDDLAKHAVIRITNANPLTVAPEYFNIYKTVAGGTTKYLVGRVRANSQAAAGTTDWNDTGLWMAGTTKAYIGQLDPSVIAVKQLAPLMKMDLAVVGPAVRWMLLLYITFILYASKKWVEVINIGSRA